MAQLRWADSAVKDLGKICDFIAGDSEIYAKLFARKVIETVERTAIFPYSGRIVPEINNEMVREKIL